MRYEAIKDLNPEAFKRLTGVKPLVFGQMAEVLKEAETEKKKMGRPSKLSLEDKVLLTVVLERVPYAVPSCGELWDTRVERQPDDHAS